MDGFFQGVGLFLCVGGIIVIALIAMAVRAFTSRGRNTAAGDYPNVFDPAQRGNERPTYDSQRVESRGGFGAPPSNIPQTGTQNRNRARIYDTQRSMDERTPGSPLPRLNSNDAPGRSSSPITDNRPRRERSRHDDDNVRSGGGFGS